MNYQDSDCEIIPHLIQQIQTTRWLKDELVVSYSPSGRYLLIIRYNKDDNENGSVFPYVIIITDMALLKTRNYTINEGLIGENGWYNEVIGFRWLSEKEISIYVPHSTSPRTNWQHIPYMLRTLILSIDHQQYSATVIAKTDHLLPDYEYFSCPVPFLITPRATSRMTIQGEEFGVLTIGHGIILCPYDIRIQKRQTPYRVFTEFKFEYHRDTPIFKDSKIFFPRYILHSIEGIGRWSQAESIFLDKYIVVDLSNINLEDDLCIIPSEAFTTIDMLNDAVIEPVPETKMWQDDHVAVFISPRYFTQKLMVTVIDLSTMRAHQKIVALDSAGMIATFHKQHLVFWENRVVDEKQYLACSKTYAGGCVPSLHNICLHMLNSYHAKSSLEGARNPKLPNRSKLLQTLFHILSKFQFNKPGTDRPVVTLPNYEKYHDIMYY